MNEHEKPLTDREKMAFTRLIGPIEAESKPTDGWDTQPRADRTTPTDFPAGHIAIQGDFEGPEPESKL